MSVHPANLFILGLSVYVSVCKLVNTCVNLASFTAWKEWHLEKKKRNLAPELVAYTLMQSFSHASHQSSHDSSSPIAIDWRQRSRPWPYLWRLKTKIIVAGLVACVAKTQHYDFDCTNKQKWLLIVFKLPCDTSEWQEQICCIRCVHFYIFPTCVRYWYKVASHKKGKSVLCTTTLYWTGLLSAWSHTNVPLCDCTPAVLCSLIHSCLTICVLI